MVRTSMDQHVYRFTLDPRQQVKTGLFFSKSDKWLMLLISIRVGKNQWLVHATYIDTLPSWEQLRTPLHFTPSELHIFKGTNLYGATLDRDHLWRMEWTACKALVGRANADWANLFTWSVVTVLEHPHLIQHSSLV